MDEHDIQAARRDDPDSLAPVHIERLSVKDEAALMGRGKGGQLIGIAAGVALCALIGGFWLRSMDSKQAYGDALGRVHELQDTRMDAFMRCVLPGVPHAQTGSSEELHTSIERMSERRGSSYGRTLQQCAPKLDAALAGLRELQPLAGTATQLKTLRGAASDLKRAWDGYREYLLDPKVVHDYVGALPRIEKIALAQSAYEHRRAALEAALRARL